MDASFILASADALAQQAQFVSDHIASPSLHDGAALLAQAQDVNIDMNKSGTAPKVSITFTDNIITLARYIAAAVAIIWVIYAIFKNLTPDNAGGGGGGFFQKIGGVKPFVIAVVLVAILFDLNATVKLINIVISIGWGLMQFIPGLGNE